MPSLDILKYIFGFTLLILLGLLINPTTVGVVELPRENYPLFPSFSNLVENNSLMATKQVDFNEDPERHLRVIVTAYSSTFAQTDSTPFITAAGTTVHEGTIANNLLPFGTIVRLPEIYGERLFVVEDRMHQRKSTYHFDIWFPSSQEARDFGVVRDAHLEIVQTI